VIGHVVSTSKHPALAGKKILVVRSSEGRGDPTEAMQLAIDSVGAGLGDEVIVT
jgi:ethanolamine utilization protein EutN